MENMKYNQNVKITKPHNSWNIVKEKLLDQHSQIPIW